MDADAILCVISVNIVGTAHTNFSTAARSPRKPGYTGVPYVFAC